jgi:hypothetical protein
LTPDQARFVDQAIFDAFFASRGRTETIRAKPIAAKGAGRSLWEVSADDNNCALIAG